ncbi:MAG: BA14K family protein [Hoeflea sp.]|uniref:BA14K family protein n=1 Tax=Hoeflea sp. TaxID=1940281 RepID=UPI003EF51A96
MHVAFKWIHLSDNVHASIQRVTAPRIQLDARCCRGIRKIRSATVQLDLDRVHASRQHRSLQDTPTGKDIPMNKIAKKLSITLLTAATAFAPLTVTANAGDHRSNRQHFRHQDDDSRFYDYRDYSERQQLRHQRRIDRRIDRRHNNNKAIALGIIGLGAAVIIGGAIANSNNPRVIYQQPSTPRAVSGGRYEPWSRSWFQYCSNRFRSFDASTGTYRGYDGRDHFCVAN